VASGRTVGELATSLRLTELGVSRAVRDLVELGVVDVALSDRPRPAAVVPPAPAAASAERPRRSAVRPDVDTSPVPAVPGPRPGQNQRAGWLSGDHTGEMPTPVTEHGPLPTRNGDTHVVDEPATTPAPPPVPEPAPPKGGLASRLGRNRNGRGADATPPEGSAPVTNGSRVSGRPPVAPTARTNDGGPATERAGEPERPTRPDLPAVRRRDTARPSSPAAPSRPGSQGVPPAPSRPGSQGVPPAPAAPGSPFDNGRLGPSPVGRDTGQIRPVSPSALPPDLHWAADDTGGGPINGGPASPFSGLSSLGPSRPGPADNEVAPHVMAMSPEARSAVQATVGNAGGSAGARGASQGEDIAQRGRLISFLSTVR